MSDFLERMKERREQLKEKMEARRAEHASTPKIEMPKDVDLVLNKQVSPVDIAAATGVKPARDNSVTGASVNTNHVEQATKAAEEAAISAAVAGEKTGTDKLPAIKTAADLEDDPTDVELADQLFQDDATTQIELDRQADKEAAALSEEIDSTTIGMREEYTSKALDDIEEERKEERRERWQGFGEKAKKVSSFASKGLSSAASLAGGIMDANGIVDEDSNFKGQMAVGDMLMSTGNPYAMAAGAAWKGLSAVDQYLGMNTNTISKDANKSVGLSEGQRIANNVLGFIPGLGALTSSTTSALKSQELDKVRGAYTGTATDIDNAGDFAGKRYLFGKNKINDFINTQNARMTAIDQISKYNTLRKSSDYSDALDQQNLNRYSGNNGSALAMAKQGMRVPTKKEISVILAKKGSKITKKNLTKSDLYNIFLQCEYILTGDVSKYIAKDISALRNNIKRNGFDDEDLQKLALDISFNQDIRGAVQELQNDLTLFIDDIVDLFEDNGKFLEDVEDVLDPNLSFATEIEIKERVLPLRDFIANYFGMEPMIDSFQNGGSIMNPAGALHAHLNHMEEENEEIGSQVTQKGIPVITTDSEGEVTQVAEIERDEIIFSKELTVEVEKLWKDGSEEAMIKAGKLIAEALIEDSTDNTGLFEKTE